VLKVRNNYDGASLATLYDRNAMPSDLVNAHTDLDRAVDGLFGKRRFDSTTERLSVLLERYQQLTADLFTPEPKKGRRRKSN
jgi:hypothetical protein